MEQFNKIQQALIAARQRTGKSTLAVAVKAGAYQVQQVVYAKNGVSTITELTDFVSDQEIVTVLEALK